MSYSLRRALVLVSFSLACSIPQPAWTAVMTFDSLPDDFSEITTYTEDGITFSAVDGAPDHFHAEENFDNGTTGAVLFSDDGTPFRIILAGGTLFDLISIVVYDIDTASGPIVFKTPGGATQTVSSLGVTNFGIAFTQVDFVQIDIPGGIDERFIGLDNIIVGTAVVPEPSTLMLALLGAVALLKVKRNIHIRERV